MSPAKRWPNWAEVRIPEMSSKKDKTRAAYCVFCCHGSACGKGGAREVMKALRSEVKDQGARDEVHFIKTECTGPCKQGPMILIASQTLGVVWYAGLKPKDAPLLVEQHIGQGRPLAQKRFFQHHLPEDDMAA